MGLQFFQSRLDEFLHSDHIPLLDNVVVYLEGEFEGFAVLLIALYIFQSLLHLVQVVLQKQRVQVQGNGFHQTVNVGLRSELAQVVEQVELEGLAPQVEEQDEPEACHRLVPETVESHIWTNQKHHNRQQQNEHHWFRFWN